MKANELMIGDWVRMHYPFDMDIDMRPERIYVLTKGVDVDCEPIPLTAEILEKNGFHHHLIAEKGFTREEWTLSDDYYEIVVREWSDSIWVFRYECAEMNTPHEQKICSYVYQLQHFFSDCGLLELADNFKV